MTSIAPLLDAWEIAEPSRAVLNQDNADDIRLDNIDDPIRVHDHLTDLIATVLRPHAAGSRELLDSAHRLNETVRELLSGVLGIECNESGDLADVGRCLIRPDYSNHEATRRSISS